MASLEPAGGFRTQSVVSPYASPDINHLVVELFTRSGSVESEVLIGGASVSRDLTYAQLGDAIVFGNLHPATSYRVRGWAYRAAGTSAANVISSDSSYVDVSVTDDDRPTVGSLPVRLLDQSFSASSSVRISLTGSCDHVYAALYKVVGGAATAVTGATGSIPYANLPGNFDLTSLGANATYRLVATARNGSNAFLASSSVDVAVTTETSAATQSLSVVVPAS